MANDTINSEVQKFYDEAFCRYLEEGLHPHEAAEQADADVLAWSQPLPLPDAPTEAWD